VKLEHVNKQFMERAHDLDLIAHGGTVNQSQQIGRLLSMGIDRIITDYPTSFRPRGSKQKEAGP
jgi:glycerophosphoryl diester phosphodiesterase